MPRYIDAQKLKDAMNIEDDTNGYFNIMTALKCVDDAPTVYVLNANQLYIPFSLRDTVYLVDRTRDGRLGSIYRVVECSVEKIVLRYSTFQKRTIMEAHLQYDGNDYFGCVVEKIVYDTSFGHTVFTNEQDAEAALEKMEKEYLEEINRERDAMKNDV